MSITSSPIQMAMSGQGYQTAMQRPRCGNCKHFREGDNPNLVDQCRLGAFMVGRWAVCQKHEFKPRGEKP